MAAMPSTVDIDCPRPGCDSVVKCTAEISPAPPKPGTRVALQVRVPDLADRMVEHYTDAHGYVPLPRPTADAGQQVGAEVGGSLEEVPL
ncbi:MAG: hypothetical protein U5N53_28450 [Mycobacterium sp.]|nr:hypothetical protein [Mycobacterium sp.]